MTVKELLDAKGSEIISVESDNTGESAIRTMIGRRISAVIVTEGGRPVGIFTERDVLRCWAASGGSPFGEIRLGDAMTADLIVAELNEDLCAVMSIMMERFIRHMPVAEKGRLLGMLSMRDVLKTQVGNLHTEIHYLKDYVSGI